MLKKIISLSLSLFLSLFAIFPLQSTSIKANDISKDDQASSYSFQGESIKETISFDLHGENVYVTRIINKDNTYTMTINDINGTTIKTGTTDYDMFYDITEYYILNGEAPNNQRADIHGKNFYHVYVDEFGPETYLHNKFVNISTVSGAISLVASALNWPAAGLIGVGSFILGIIDESPAKMVIASTTNEVFFSYDNIYYTHCYHQVVELHNAQHSHYDTRYFNFTSVGG